MLGSRLLGRLREHDWLAAVIELAIVVVGILLALQVDNWNQERLDHERGQRYAQRLRTELLGDVAAMDKTTAFWQQVTTYGLGAINYGEHGTLVDGDSWKTVLAFYQAGQLYPFELGDTTFVEMRDTGGLALISDESLRKRIADYYRATGSGLQADILHHRPAYREQIRGLTPWSVQEYVWSHCFRQGAGIDQQLLDCPSPISDEAARALLATYRSSDSLLANLRIWMTTLHVSRIIVTNMRGDALTLADDFAKAGGVAGAAPVHP